MADHAKTSGIHGATSFPGENAQGSYLMEAQPMRVGIDIAAVGSQHHHGDLGENVPTQSGQNKKRQRQPENLFKEDPNLNGEQRKELGDNMGIQYSQQTNCWFQNNINGSQMKIQNERCDNYELLRTENVCLRSEVQTFKESMGYLTFPDFVQQVAISGDLPKNGQPQYLESANPTDKMKRKAHLTRKARGKARVDAVPLPTPSAPATSPLPIFLAPEDLPIANHPAVTDPMCPINQLAEEFLSLSTLLSQENPPMYMDWSPLYTPTHSQMDTANPSICNDYDQNFALMFTKPDLSNPSMVTQPDQANSKIMTPHEVADALLLPFDEMNIPDQECHEFIELVARSAINDIVVMATASDPLWVTCSTDGTSCLLSEQAYDQAFPRFIGPRKKPGFITEGSRKSAMVKIDPLHLIDICMDVKKWSTFFAGIVSTASTVDVLSAGQGGTFNGMMQLMNAEFQFPSPLVPTRESYFVRYCGLYPDGTWAMVDVSVDEVRSSKTVVRCFKRPSGFLIRKINDSCSQITWIEHVEVDYTCVNEIYTPALSVGLGFGASRWVATLDRQCERLSLALAGKSSITDIEVKKSMVRLSERMVLYFTEAVGPVARGWTRLPGVDSSDSVRIMTRLCKGDPGRHKGLLLSATVSFWLPALPKFVFEFLCNKSTRDEWDIFPNAGMAAEIQHFADIGAETRTFLSLLQVDRPTSSSQNPKMLLLQESCLDPTASYVVYSPVEDYTMSVVLSGGNPDSIPLLATGFSILPYTLPVELGGGGPIEATSGSCIVTMGHQAWRSSRDIDAHCVAELRNLMVRTIDRVTAAITKALNDPVVG